MCARTRAHTLCNKPLCFACGSDWEDVYRQDAATAQSMGVTHCRYEWTNQKARLRLVPQHRVAESIHTQGCRPPKTWSQILYIDVPTSTGRLRRLWLCVLVFIRAIFASIEVILNIFGKQRKWMSAEWYGEEAELSVAVKGESSRHFLSVFIGIVLYVRATALFCTSWILCEPTATTTSKW